MCRLVKRLWEISRQLDAPQLQYEYFRSTCKQFFLLKEYNEDAKQIFKELILLMIQYGVEEEHVQVYWRSAQFEWTYPNRDTIVFELLNGESLQATGKIYFYHFRQFLVD